MCFLCDGTLERAASATGQLGFIQQAWMDTQRWPPDRTPLHCQPDRRSQVNADLLRLNLILLVIPDQRVFLKSTVTRQEIKKRGAWGKMTVNQGVISWRWHQRQADPSGRQRRVDMLPRVLPGEVPGSLRRVLCASAPRLRVLVTRTERLSGPNALNHRPAPAHCQGQHSPGSGHILGGSETPLVHLTGLLQVIVTSSYANWYGDVWCCYDTLPAFESAPMSTRLYTEWMIPPKCILEFCTNTFSELSKQCRPLSRCIVYAFFFFFFFLAPWLGWVSEWESSEVSNRKRNRRRQRDREREKERHPPSPKDISSMNCSGRFSIPSAFSFYMLSRSLKVALNVIGDRI